MSGGSFDYLCTKDYNDLCNQQAIISEMRDKLTEMGYEDAARETESVNLIIDAFRVRMETRLKRLSNVWHAVEWYVSHDYGRDQVEKAIEKYRES